MAEAGLDVLLESGSLDGDLAGCGKTISAEQNFNSRHF
jgi:hypothetical protein